MEELMVVANVAIVFGVIYKLFELYVRRQERIMLIEKLSSGWRRRVQGKSVASVLLFR